MTSVKEVSCSRSPPFAPPLWSSVFVKNPGPTLPMPGFTIGRWGRWRQNAYQGYLTIINDHLKFTFGPGTPRSENMYLFVSYLSLSLNLCNTDYLKQPVDEYMTKFPKVKVIHLKERHGLVRARMVGAAMAKAQVLTFLDSHIECTVGWLEPLLQRVKDERTNVACSVIDEIDSINFA